MAFRIDESVKAGSERVFSKLAGPGMDHGLRRQAEFTLKEILAEYGPVVESYPYWHPLVAGQDYNSNPITVPREECGFEGLDHTVLLRDGLITCPYDDGSRVLESVEKLKQPEEAEISAERIESPLHSPNASPILIKCDWVIEMDFAGWIPKRIALGLLLEREIPSWRWAKVAETWETMRPYILGQPCGGRSSLFVSQETGQALKTVWKSLMASGLFGPMRERD